jgi:hypothetical protein
LFTRSSEISPFFESRSNVSHQRWYTSSKSIKFQILKHLLSFATAQKLHVLTSILKSHACLAQNSCLGRLWTRFFPAKGFLANILLNCNVTMAGARTFIGGGVRSYGWITSLFKQIIDQWLLQRKWERESRESCLNFVQGNSYSY